MKKKIFSLFLLIFGLNILFGQTEFELLNPSPTSQTGFKIHFTSMDVGYINTLHSLLKTTDGGENWTIVRSLNGSLDMKFYDNIAYIAGFNSFVIKSLDYGETWQSIDTGFEAAFNAINIIDENLVILSTENSIIKSYDGGNNWEEFEIPNVTVQKTFFTSALVGHAACKRGTILKTIDGGETWYATETTNTTPSDYYSIYFKDENNGFAGRWSAVYRTTDGGETWFESQRAGIIHDFQFINENDGFMVGAYIYKTRNGGEYWDDIPYRGLRNGEPDEMTGVFFHNTGIGHVSGERGVILKTNTAGGIWYQYSPTYNDIEQIQMFNNGTGYAKTRINFYKTTDYGNTWTKIRNPYSNNKISFGFQFLDRNTGFSYGQSTNIGSGDIIKTSDGGNSWESFDMGAGSPVRYAHFINEDIGFASYNNSGSRKLKKTVDGGNSWTEVLDKVVLKIQFLNNNLGYAKGNDGLYKTTDQGETWVLLETNISEIRDFHFVSETFGYFISESNLFKTLDGGDTWEEYEYPWYLDDFADVHFISESEGYLTANSGYLYKTENGGYDWEVIFASGEMYLSFINNLFIGTTNGRIFRSTSRLNTEDFSEPDKLNQGIILHPNPANDIATLILPPGNNDKITSIEIFNVLGQKIYSDSMASTSDVGIDVSNFESGLYFIFVKLETNRTMTTKLLISE